jgi:hypothetical protein
MPSRSPDPLLPPKQQPRVSVPVSKTTGPASVQRILTDPTSSDWIKSALHAALQRDPVNALNDALLLAGILEERLRLLFYLTGVEELAREED